MSQGKKSIIRKTKKRKNNVEKIDLTLTTSLCYLYCAFKSVPNFFVPFFGYYN